MIMNIINSIDNSKIRNIILNKIKLVVLKTLFI